MPRRKPQKAPGDDAGARASPGGEVSRTDIRRTARASLLTPVAVATIETALRAGLTVRVACDLGGISHETFYAWMRSGEADPGGDFGDFHARVRRAQAEAQRSLVERVETASQDPQHWKAAAWLLETRWPGDWGKKGGIPREVFDAFMRAHADAVRAVAARYGLDGAAVVAEVADEVKRLTAAAEGNGRTETTVTPARANGGGR